jgi:hypothetical protein
MTPSLSRANPGNDLQPTVLGDTHERRAGVRHRTRGVPARASAFGSPRHDVRTRTGRADGAGGDAARPGDRRRPRGPPETRTRGSDRRVDGRPRTDRRPRALPGRVGGTTGGPHRGHCGVRRQRPRSARRRRLAVPGSIRGPRQPLGVLRRRPRPGDRPPGRPDVHALGGDQERSPPGPDCRSAGGARAGAAAGLLRDAARSEPR